MKKVYVGMSGGVDSTATALLLLKEGYEVTGITFVGINEQGSKKCCSIEEINSAKNVCQHLGIYHQTVDLKDIFEAKIINYFIESYKSGLTPNPCIYCNKFIKFGVLLDYCLSLGADYFATGHYAIIEKFENELLIKRGSDENKDQSYFLSYIEKEKLPFIILPLGKYNKNEIRKILEKENIPINPNKSESQDICFIKDDYRDFLISKNVEYKQGYFIYNNKIIGTHRGIPFYSFGQRKGLGISVGNRIYVRNFDLTNNKIYLGNKPISKKFKIKNLNIFTKNFIDGDYDIQVRYQSKVLKANVIINDNYANIELLEPYEIVTPGQFCVIYKNNYVFAAGEIYDVELLD